MRREARGGTKEPRFPQQITKVKGYIISRKNMADPECPSVCPE